MFNWLDASQAKEFGASLAAFFIERVPANERINEKKFSAKIEKILRQMSDQIVRFKVNNKLNAYKKAQLGNSFKWALKDAGFAAEQIDQLTKWLMLQVS